jgi:hypothetical protein
MTKRKQRSGLLLSSVFGFEISIVIVVASPVWESGKPAFGFPFSQGREAEAV